MALLVNDKTNVSPRLFSDNIGTASYREPGTLPRPLTQWLPAPVVALGSVALSGGLLSAMQNGLHFALPLLVGIVAAFFVARFFGAIAGLLYTAGWLFVLHFAHLFAADSGLLLFVRFIEASALSLGATGVGLLLRDREQKVARLHADRAAQSAIIEAARKRQQSFLRDVLATVTQRRLVLCELPADLPVPFPFAPGEEPIPLAAAALSDVRARIRKAGSAVGVSDFLVGDLVIAGSEASLNAVVHATGGVAEIRADERGSLQVWIRDNGKGIDDAFLHRAILEAGFSSKGTLGQGFSLIVSTCHRVYLHTTPAGTTLVLETETPEQLPSACS